MLHVNYARPSLPSLQRQHRWFLWFCQSCGLTPACLLVPCWWGHKSLLLHLHQLLCHVLPCSHYTPPCCRCFHTWWHRGRRHFSFGLEWRSEVLTAFRWADPWAVASCLRTGVSPSVCGWWSRSGPRTREGRSCTGTAPARRGSSCAERTWPRPGSRSHSGRSGWSGRPAWTRLPFRESNDPAPPFQSPFASLLHPTSPPPSHSRSSSPAASQLTPSFSSRHRLLTRACSQHWYLSVLLPDPKELHFLTITTTMTTAVCVNEAEEEGNVEEPEEEAEENTERHNKAPCSSADDAVPRSPSHWDSGRYLRGWQDCWGYWCYQEPQRRLPSCTWSRTGASLTLGSNQGRWSTVKVMKTEDTDIFQSENLEESNWTVWTDACIFLWDFLSLIHLHLCFHLVLMSRLRRRCLRCPLVSMRRGHVREEEEEAFVCGSPGFDWPGRPGWIEGSGIGGRAAGSSWRRSFDLTPPHSCAPRRWFAAAWAWGFQTTANRDWGVFSFACG